MSYESIESYALKILADAGCDCYTYGGEQSKHVLEDLKTAYPDGIKYGYVNVANAILSISRPAPIKRAKYRVHWDTDSCSDGYDADSFEAAKCDAEDTLINWMSEEMSGWKADSPTEEEMESWDYMVYNCGVSVAEYDVSTDEYVTVWTPSQEELDEMGWRPFEN